MDYKIGDTVVHWTHGLGQVIAIDEKQLAGVVQKYYVVEVGILKLWVPTSESNGGQLRHPLDGVKFKTLLKNLQTPGERLPENYTKRRFALRNRMQKRNPDSLCLLIRDLSQRSRDHTLNPNDTDVLFRAQEGLLDEWVISLGIKRENAQLELDVLLQGEHAEIQKKEPWRRWWGKSDYPA